MHPWTGHEKHNAYNMTTTLTTWGQRGTLTYIKADYTYRTIEGWFHLNGNTVVRRVVGGRNFCNLCETNQVFSFIPYEAKN
jgi:hypothetical protein